MSGPRTLAPFVIAGTLVLVTLAVLVSGMKGPLGYDEAYNLQVPLHLVLDGSYATDGSVYATPRPRDFDVFISTGPSLLLPVAGAMAVFGTHLWVARLIGSLTYLALIGVALRIGWRVGRFPGAVVAWLGVLAVDLRTDGFRGMGGSGAILGETAATALLLGSSLVVRRRAGAAGLLVGVAIMAKFLTLLVLPVFAIAVIVAGDPCGPGRLGRFLRFGAGALLPTLSWNVWKYIALGPDLYRDRFQEFAFFFIHSGSGIGVDGFAVIGRHEAISSVLRGAGPLLTLVVGLAVATAAVAWLLVTTPKDSRPAQSADNFATTAVLVVSGSLIIVWWAFLSTRPMGRYLVGPVVMLLVGILPILVATARVRMDDARHGRRSSRGVQRLGRLGTALALAGLVGLSVGHVRSALATPALTLADQRAVAEHVRAAGGAFGSGWLQGPEVRFFSGVPSLGSLTTRGGLRLFTPTERALDGAEVERESAKCTDTVFSHAGYLLCTVAPSK